MGRAIEGSTTAFPVRGLLEFLGTTGRTGRLLIDAAPQVGLVALRQGRLVAAGLGAGGGTPSLLTPTGVDDLGELLVDLVSLPAARFAFHPDGVDGEVDGFAVTDALAAAGLDSPDRDAADDAAAADSAVRLAEEPAFGAVTVAPELWEVLARVGDGTSPQDLAAQLGLGLSTVRRRLAGLHQLGLIEPGVAATAGA